MKESQTTIEIRNSKQRESDLKEKGRATGEMRWVPTISRCNRDVTKSTIVEAA